MDRSARSAHTLRDVLVIGLGHMGALHLRAYLNLSCQQWVRRVYAYDPSKAKRQLMHQTWPQLWMLSKLTTLPEQVDAISICTPAQSHFELAQRCLRAGKAVLVEKPLTLGWKQAVELAQRAYLHHAYVGHSERFNPGFWNFFKVYLNHCGSKLEGFKSQRWAIQPSPHGVDPILDLMIHDLDLLYLLSPWQSMPEILVQHRPKHAVQVKLIWPEFRASCEVWTHAPQKRRMLEIQCESHLWQLDLLNARVQGPWMTQNLPWAMEWTIEKELTAFVQILKGQTKVDLPPLPHFKDLLAPLELAEHIKTLLAME